MLEWENEIVDKPDNYSTMHCVLTEVKTKVKQESRGA